MRALPTPSRPGALLIAGLVVSSACAPATERANEPPTDARAAATPASAAVAGDAGPPDAADAGESAPVDAIRTALEAITRPQLVRDFETIARPRHHNTAPTHLAAAAAYVKSELGAAGFEVTTQQVTFKKATADNVIGERAGEDPTRAVIVCAHYDAVRGTPGADDNASGVVGVLGIARAAAAVRTTASIRVVTFAFEEQGLIGSEAYAQSLSAADRARIVGVINLDMIAYRDKRPGSQRNLLDRGTVEDAGAAGAGDFIAVQGLTESPALFEALDAARVYEPDLRIETMAVPRLLLGSASDLLRSDHASFWEVQVPALTIVDTAEMRNPHYHRPTDTIATLDLDFALSVTRWAGAATLKLAGAKPKPAAPTQPSPASP